MVQVDVEFTLLYIEYVDFEVNFIRLKPVITLCLPDTFKLSSLAFVDICLVIISEWYLLSYQLLWFW